jgi:serine/threonine protein kinase
MLCCTFAGAWRGYHVLCCDMQPENILCGESLADIKLADFGLSKLVTPHEIMRMACGTLSYVGAL